MVHQHYYRFSFDIEFLKKKKTFQSSIQTFHSSFVEKIFPIKKNPEQIQPSFWVSLISFLMEKKHGFFIILYGAEAV